jgi:hypothetical protein
MRYYQCDQCGMVIGEGAKWDTHAPGCTGGAIHEVITVRVGSREWAIVQTMTGHSICHRSDPKLLIENPAYILINCTGPGHEHMADGWSLYKPEPPPWQPKPGERVRWKRGKDSGTGTYQEPYTLSYASGRPHAVLVDDISFAVESVSPLEECTLLLERHLPSEPPPVVGKRYLVGWKSGTMQTVTTPERRWPDGIVWWAEVPREESDG